MFFFQNIINILEDASDIANLFISGKIEEIAWWGEALGNFAKVIFPLRNNKGKKFPELFLNLYLVIARCPVYYTEYLRLREYYL